MNRYLVTVEYFPRDPATHYIAAYFDTRCDAVAFVEKYTPSEGSSLAIHMWYLMDTHNKKG